ncbi:MAG: hypothetical protein U0573_14140 [Phycisphaerales bacterium]|nr:hypothetical protein [Planctomycetota bacterium]
MSAKWRRSLAWDDRNFPQWAWALKALLRLFSSIPLAVVLLLLVVFYGILASVPVGIVVLGLTQLFYGATLVAAAAVPAAIGVFLVRKITPPGAIRFVISFVALLAGATVGVLLWLWFAWPKLRYDPVGPTGVRFFAQFIEANKAITLRRLPGMEMSELEFYGWWPLRLVLVLFVVNMIVATVRRIEFNFKNIGVLTVHSGIVLIALGSIYYNGLKREGDTLLLASQRGAGEEPEPGPLVNSFYDSTLVSLYVQEFGQFGPSGLEQRVLNGIPRYNNYNLGAFSGKSMLEAGNRKRPWIGVAEEGALDVPVQSYPLKLVDPSVRFRVVGYAAYADPVEDWKQVDPASLTGIREGFRLNPLRTVFLTSGLADEKGVTNDKPVFSFFFLPGMPARRLSVNDVMGVEYTLGPGAGMTAERWADLSTPLPTDTEHALIVEIPGKDGGEKIRKVVPVRPGSTLKVGPYELRVDQLTPEPPFPIVTESHKGATSSVAVVHIKPPQGDGYSRYIYHRFPELNQDILDTPRPDGRMNRRDADPAIRIAYLDASKVQAYFDEPAAGGPVRAIVRRPGGNVRVIDELPGGMLEEFVPKVSLRVDQRWAHAERSDRPGPVPPEEQDKRMVGTHEKAMLAVEVIVPGDAQRGTKEWSTVVWLPFQKFLGMDRDAAKRVNLPDGRQIELTFGRARHVFRDFSLRLVDFKMIAYDHRGAPRDFESIVRVEPSGTSDVSFGAFTHACSLNEPLTAPFHWSDSRPWIRNAAYRIASGFDPNQFKMSQAAWDQDGWRESQKLADAGLLPAPRARFTILQVGNNPGIHVIALGGILMALGIPWAFYLKPWLVRREKRLIQEQVARGEYRPPVRKAQREVVVVRREASPSEVRS